MVLVIVVLAGADDPPPPSKAVAMFVMDTAVVSFCVTVYGVGALQVTVVFGASVVFAGPQLNGVGLIRLSFTVN